MVKTIQRNGRWAAWTNPDYLYCGNTKEEALKRHAQAMLFGAWPRQLVCDNSRTIQRRSKSDYYNGYGPGVF